MLIEDETAKIWLDDGIIHFEYKAGVVVDLEVQKRNIENRILIAAGISRPIFADGRHVKYWTSDAKNYSLTKEGLYLASAFGILYNSSISKIILNWTMSFMSPKVPMKFFTDKEEALDWLKQFK